MCNGFCKISMRRKISHFHFKYGTASKGSLFLQIWVQQSDIATCIGKNIQSLLDKEPNGADWLAVIKYSHSNYHILVLLLLY